MKPFNNFSDITSTPFFWWIKANDLFSAATAIMESWTAAKAAYFDPLPKESGRVRLTPRQREAWPRLRFPQVYLFIVGLAFENLIKGLLIARDPGLVKDGKLSADISTGHGLSHLFDKANLSHYPTKKITSSVGYLTVFFGLDVIQLRKARTNGKCVFCQMLLAFYLALFLLTT